MPRQHATAVVVQVACQNLFSGTYRSASQALPQAFAPKHPGHLRLRRYLMVPMRMLPILLFAALTRAAFAQAPGEPTGWIQGRVVDPTNAPLVGFLRVLQPDSRVLVLRQRAQGPEFKSNALRPGSYVLKVWAAGFRQHVPLAVTVQPGKVMDVGTIQMEVAGCDAPGVICDTVVPTRPPLAYGHLSLKLDCGLDLDKGKVSCPAASRADLLCAKDETGVYLSPANGAAAAPDCRVPKYEPTRIRIDGFGPGDDLCVRTSSRHLAHLFFEDDVQRDSLEVRLYYVTK